MGDRRRVVEPRYGCEDLGVTTNGGVWIWMLQNINFRTSEVRESGNLKNWGGGACLDSDVQ